jgi:multiple sugar transport system ATP-binding protein
MATVETKALVKQFTGHTAVDGVDLAIHEGEFLVLLGPSGCGKTTLLRMIAGLEIPTSGEILISGKVVNELPPRARKIAMVFQSYALYPHLSVAKNIAFPLKAQGAPRESIAGEVERAAKMFGIDRLLQRKPRQLSGGERQRVALARAMVRHPDVFLLDEPLSNLDAKLRNLARDELKQFQRRLGTTTIYVTHDQVEAMGLGDRIAVMSGGKVRQLGRPQEVYDDPADTFVAGFLGSPPMNLINVDGALVGIRPEHLLPPSASGTEGATIPMRYAVERVEHLGAGRLLYGTLPDYSAKEKVIVSLAYTVHSSIEAGHTYDFRVHQSNLKFFDPTTGLRVPPRALSPRRSA